MERPDPMEKIRFNAVLPAHNTCYTPLFNPEQLKTIAQTGQDAHHHSETTMHNEDNAGLRTDGLSVIAAHADEPKSRVLGHDGEAVVVTDTNETVSNAPLKQGVKVSTPHVEHVVHIRDRPKPRAHVARVDHGPARGAQLASALTAALVSANKTVEQFPKAPQPKFKGKRRDFPKHHAPRDPNSKAPRPQFNAKGGHRPSRGGNRGK